MLQFLEFFQVALAKFLALLGGLLLLLQQLGETFGAVLTFLGLLFLLLDLRGGFAVAEADCVGDLLEAVVLIARS